MKKILFIDTGLEFGGGTKSFLYLLDALIAKNDYEILTYFENDYLVNEKKISQILNEHGAQYLQFHPARRMGKFKKELFRMFSKELVHKKMYTEHLNFARELLRSANPDLIHLNNHFSTNLAYNAAANELGIKVIQHCRKNATIENFKLKILKELKFKTICVSQSTYEFYKSQICIDKNVIYNPIEMSGDFCDNRDPDIINIVMPANFLSLKGHDLVFEAMIEIKRSDIRLILAGSGVFEGKVLSNFELLKKRGIAKHIGFVENMSEIYEKSDFVLGFSSDEGLPRVVIEGLAKGCGIIFSDIKVAREIYEMSSLKDIFYIVDRNKMSLKECLENIKKPKNKQADHSIIKKFSLENYIKSVDFIYKSIFNTKTY